LFGFNHSGFGHEGFSDRVQIIRVSREPTKRRKRESNVARRLEVPRYK